MGWGNGHLSGGVIQDHDVRDWHIRQKTDHPTWPRPSECHSRRLAKCQNPGHFQYPYDRVARWRLSAMAYSYRSWFLDGVAMKLVDRIQRTYHKPGVYQTKLSEQMIAWGSAPHVATRVVLHREQRLYPGMHGNTHRSVLYTDTPRDTEWGNVYQGPLLLYVDGLVIVPPTEQHWSAITRLGAEVRDLRMLEKRVDGTIDPIGEWLIMPHGIEGPPVAPY